MYGQLSEEGRQSSDALNVRHTENTHLLSDARGNSKDDLVSSWTQDAQDLVKNAIPVIFAGLLQQSIGLCNVFSVGHLGKTELAAVSLSLMTANITGYAVYQGMATALDTLCAQAYGSAKKPLIGLYFQQMVLILWLMTIPIGIIWLNSATLLGAVVPDKSTADLAGTYLRILLLGAPGYAAFEAGKRFVQSQCIFHATTLVLLSVAPLNAFMNWLFVWHWQMGFIGAPLSTAVTNNLLPFFLFLYVYFIDGSKCWNGFTLEVFQNWTLILELAFPGFLMLEAEFLAFEILTLGASHLSTTHLAAQSILSPLIALSFQVPFALAIASSTRIANLIGGGFADRARQCTRVAILGASLVGTANFFLMIGLAGYVAHLLTNDTSVIQQVMKVVPVIATFQLFDSFVINMNGTLRALGKQTIGSFVGVVCYYAIAMPISFTTAFRLQWNLIGLWSGIAVALFCNSIIVWIYLAYKASWEDAVNAARSRHTKP
ncbi:hypothetical protein S40288_05797 [Stachybotrys chartarum IBT 40288]|nr:hypothetical protein S40288_05797 [Stachybotrys chartarum IBT 40288]